MNLIKDLYILKNGLPIFTKEIDPGTNVSKILTDENSLVDKEDRITMISGFFSAINSFIKTIVNYGEISELKMTNDIKFSFFKPKNAIDLLFVGSSDCAVDQSMIKSLLSKISSEFVRKFPVIKGKKWCGEINMFQKFDENLSEIIKESELTSNQTSLEEDYPIEKLKSALQSNKPSFFEILENLKSNSKEKVKRIEKRNSNNIISEIIRKENKMHQNRNNNKFTRNRSPSQISSSYNSFYNLIPIKRIEINNGIHDLFAGEDSKRIYKLLDGNNDINSIGRLTGISQERIFNLCKGFIKKGFISFAN